MEYLSFALDFPIYRSHFGSRTDLTQKIDILSTMEYHCNCPLCRRLSTKEHIVEIDLNDATIVDAQTQCAICLEEFNLGETLSILRCNHIFHKECIAPWIEQSSRTGVQTAVDNVVIRIEEDTVEVPPRISFLDRYCGYAERYETCALITACFISYLCLAAFIFTSD